MQGSDSVPTTPTGPTRAARVAARPVTSLGMGLAFDPSKVKLKASPQPTRKKEITPNTNTSPFDDIRKNLRPTTQFDLTPIKPKSSSSADIYDLPSPESQKSKTTPTSPLSGRTPPKVPAKRKTEKKEKEETSLPKILNEADINLASPKSAPVRISRANQGESMPDFLFSPRSGTKVPLDRKKKGRTKVKLTSFLVRRPTKETLVSDGILAYPELGSEFHNEHGTQMKEKPVMQHGRTCITPNCGKKLRGKKVCYFLLFLLSMQSKLIVFFSRIIVIIVVMYFVKHVCTKIKNLCLNLVMIDPIQSVLFVIMTGRKNKFNKKQTI